MENKDCRRCGLSQPLSNFRHDIRYRSGRASWCASCHRQRNSEWARENRERLNAKAAAWRAANPAAARAADRKHKAANKDSLATRYAAWSRLNKDKRRETDAAYRAAKRRATPSWANRSEIRRIYAAAVRMERETGMRMHVDHIVPIQSDSVCGLHWEANLRVIPGSENESKRNFWWPGMNAPPAAKVKTESML
jgi:hypothetical protein